MAATLSRPRCVKTHHTGQQQLVKNFQYKYQACQWRGDAKASSKTAMIDI